MNKHLSRRSDAETSGLAAASIDLDLSERHLNALAAIDELCPATDLEMAQHLHRLGHGSEESCRRLIRTLREEHGRLVAALDDDGVQIRHENTTGRWADCWKPGNGIPSAPRSQTDSIAARVARTVQVIVDGVEHVRFDGDVYYLASDLYEALIGFDDTVPPPEPDPVRCVHCDRPLDGASPWGGMSVTNDGVHPPSHDDCDEITGSGRMF